MLPDIPQTKAELADWFAFLVAVAELRHAPLLAKVTYHRVHEGRRTTFRRRDGESISTETEEIVVRTEHATQELSTLDMDALRGVADDIGRRMAERKMEMFFRAINEATDRDGTSMDFGGRVFTADMILDMLEAVRLDFNPDGTPCMPSLLMNPEMLERVRPELERAEKDHELDRRCREIIQRQRGEWLARQAHRRLVE